MNADASGDVPPTGDVRAGTRWLLTAFAVLTLLGVTGLLLLADVADRYWAWTIHTELTAAFLGAAYASGFALALVALRQRDWSRIRVPVLTVTAFTWLTAVATVDHMHRFNLRVGDPVARAAAWVWFAVYLVVPVACLVVVVRQERHRVRADPVARPMPGWLAVALAVQGAVVSAAGVALYVAGTRQHHPVATSGAGFWPWELMPLGAMVIGAWLIALGVGAALAIAQRDLDRLLVSGVTYTAFGVFQFVAVAWYWPQVTRHDASLWIYLAMLAAIVATGGYGWRAARQHPADDGGSDRSAAPDQPAATGAGRPADVSE